MCTDLCVCVCVCVCFFCKECCAFIPYVKHVCSFSFDEDDIKNQFKSLSEGECIGFKEFSYWIIRKSYNNPLRTVKKHNDFFFEIHAPNKYLFSTAYTPPKKNKKQGKGEQLLLNVVFSTFGTAC